MHTLNFYLREAKKNQDFKSNRKLCEALGVSHNVVNAYNNGSLPNDDTMVKLADMAGIDHETALMDLNMWRAPDAVKSTYANILQKLSRTTAAIAILGASTLTATSANASMNTMATSEHVANNEYILSRFIIWFKKTKSALIQPLVTFLRTISEPYRLFPCAA